MNYAKATSLLLLSLIPLSFIGYWFAVDLEHLFFLYEWSLVVLMLAIVYFSFLGIYKEKKNKWIFISTLAFTIQMSVLFLFIGPFTHFSFIMIYYVTSTITTILMVISLKKLQKYRYLPITFLFFSILSTLYVILINNLWGKDLSFILLF
ncbi:hypothetical protein [Peribacillus acanthi]|uniref:hypothetical protein n=1 Tax=Peribacillus acanthi TaxID=2171554 RepID=UPI000D3E9E63|nr:hypothetical protein [Peribacillus acanthi]